MQLLDTEHEADFRAHLAVFEGRSAWPYLDSAGNVTIGVGCLIASEAEFAALRWAGSPNDQEIQAAWEAIKSARPGLALSAYESITTLRLPDSEIDRLLNQRIANTEGDLILIIPTVWDYPQPVRVGVLDMGWNLGAQKLHTQFFAQGCHFGPACQRKDWTTAAAESKRKEAPEPGGIQPARNAYVRDLILSCVVASVKTIT